jgi:hypothetical protein
MNSGYLIVYRPVYCTGTNCKHSKSRSQAKTWLTNPVSPGKVPSACDSIPEAGVR